MYLTACCCIRTVDCVLCISAYKLQYEQLLITLYPVASTVLQAEEMCWCRVALYVQQHSLDLIPTGSKDTDDISLM
jgi:hypothetical protein